MKSNNENRMWNKWNNLQWILYFFYYYSGLFQFAYGCSVIPILRADYFSPWTDSTNHLHGSYACVIIQDTWDFFWSHVEGVMASVEMHQSTSKNENKSQWPNKYLKLLA